MEVNPVDENARLRDELRPHGTVAASCPDCVLYDTCGGIEPQPSLLDDCFLRDCCGGPDCDDVCFYNGRFVEQVSEVGGLSFDTLPTITQGATELPVYVPMVHHQYSRQAPLDWPVVVLDTHQVFRLTHGRYQAAASNADALRRAFRPSAGTRVILKSTGKDPCLERYWSYRRRDRAPDQMCRLGTSLVVGPDF